MEERKRRKDLNELIILGMISILLIGLLGVSAVKFKMNMNTKIQENPHYMDDNTNDKDNTNDSDDSEIDNDSDNQNNTSNEELVKPTPSDKPSDNNSDNNSNSNTNNPDTPVTNYGEADVVSYFSNMEISTFSGVEDNTSFRDKAKNAFTTVVDFLFYGSEIHGYTFSELTTTAKLKVIKIALSIDNKIDEYFPNYKDTIKEKMTNLKEKAALLYLEQTAKLCEKVGDSACQEAREDFKNMKESFGFTWDLIKNAASSSYTSLKTILDEWYQSIR